MHCKAAMASLSSRMKSGVSSWVPRCLLLAVHTAVGCGLAEVAMRPAADQAAACADGDMLRQQTPH